jgi:4-hydroxy-3-methylbut-2-enyl diphosphate reductase
MCYDKRMTTLKTVVDILPRGFCKGVYQAIELAKKARRDHPQLPITILGELVHNQSVIEGLAELGITTLDSKGKTRLELLETITEGLVIFTAHGVSPQVIQRAKDLNLMTMDATCEDVLSTQRLMQSYLEADYHILYIGQPGHPEPEAACGLSERITLVDPKGPIPALIADKLFVTNQTTMSTLDIQATLTTIQARYPHAILSDETCSATRMRQEAILKLPATIDGVVIVGDRRSNNTAMLAKIAANRGIKKVIAIQRVTELNLDDLEGVETVAVSAGASTPRFLIDEVTSYLKGVAAGEAGSVEDYTLPLSV